MTIEEKKEAEKEIKKEEKKEKEMTVAHTTSTPEVTRFMTIMGILLTKEEIEIGWKILIQLM